MNPVYERQLDGLRNNGWQVKLLSEPQSLPENILKRYPWIPPDLRELFEEANVIIRPDECAWILTVTDFSGSGDAAFAWNAWERISLEAADGLTTVVGWRDEIIAFWDDHLPVLNSVKDGYAYFALERKTMKIVHGREPEFEETEPVAGSVTEMLELLIAGDARLDLWI